MVWGKKSSETVMAALNDSEKLPPNPFYPLGSVVEGYIDNVLTMPELLTSFAAGSAVILAAAYLVAKRARPGMRGLDVAAVMWFMLSGMIHFFFEGYYSYNFRRMGEMQDIFGQLWKEYALADSRYMTNDAFVLCMETITAFFWGPLCFFVSWCIVTDSPLRHPVQIIISLGQMYGDVLYYAICMFEHVLNGVTYSRPEFMYFWIYFFAINFIWIVIPACLTYQSVTTISSAFTALAKVDTKLKSANGKKHL